MGRALALAVCLASCVGYTGALGYRARQAAIAEDVERFDALMKEAVTEGPQYEGDKPVQTVLVHFMSLGGHPRFLPTIESWRKRGWVDDRFLCSVYRARARGVRSQDPAGAAEMSERAVGEARNAARAGDRAAALDCLSGSDFLVATSTAALAPWLRIARDPAEPPILREVLLDAMTDWSFGEMADLAGYTSQLLAIVHAARTSSATNPEPLVAGTSRVAAEMERLATRRGKTFLGVVSASGNAADRELAWAWVRKLQSGDPNKRYVDLGIWNRDREPGGDAYWYACATPRGKQVDLVLVLARSVLPDESALRKSACSEVSKIDGPYPLRISAERAAESKHGLPVEVVQVSPL